MSVEMTSDKSNETLDELFEQYGTLRKFKKNEFVFMKGEDPEGVYLIKKGLLKVCQFTAKGQNITFFIRKTGDSFGLAEIILNESHPCYAQCLHDCAIWVLDATILTEKMKDDLDLNKKILVQMTNRLIHQQSTVERLTSKSVSERLAWFLKEISVLNGDSELVVKMLLTHEEISNVIGCSRQTVTEILNKWRVLGKIKYSRKELIVIDPVGFTEN